MARQYNFSPGPSALPDEVMARLQESFCDYQQAGAGLVEISHRSAAFLEVRAHAESLLRELLTIPDSYHVLFLAGGASLQDAAIPMNLLADEKAVASYILTGRWSQRAEAEARRFCQTHIAADEKKSGYTTLPQDYNIAADSNYCFYVDNETVHGVEFAAPPPCDSPRVVDMSSNLLSRPININDYGLIYACAQKQLGIAGVTLVIVRSDLICPRDCTPSVLDYAKQAAASSLYNTPPVFAIVAMRECLQWLAQRGGCEWAAEQSDLKSQRLYAMIDESNVYRAAVQDPAARSRMNIPFFLKDESKTDEFLHAATKAGLLYLKGHKAVGGCRASLYNHIPLAAADSLVDFMHAFANKRGLTYV